MNKKRSRFGIISGILAFILCLAGGLVVIIAGSGEGAIWLGIGLYFIGQAFFVGPMLIIVSLPGNKD
jgi:hypothetical protein